MELLEILEERVSSLAAEIKFLRRENAKLRQAQPDVTLLTQENNHLKRALKEEQQSRDVMEKRLNTLLSFIDGVVSGQ